MFKMTDIVKSFGASKVLRGVCLEVEKGEAVCIAGANATGKTTLMTIAAAQLRADGGTVRLDGTAGYVPQESALMAELSVRDNLALWYAACGRPKSALLRADSPEYALGLAPYAGRRIGKLSGGLKKRAAIACALSGQPEYLLMDEPFTALDLQSRGEIICLLRRLVDGGMGLFFSSHDPAAVAELADRVLLLRDGGIAEQLRPEGTQPQRLEQVISLLSRA